MVQRDRVIRRMILMRVNKQQQGTDHAEKHQWSRPRWVLSPTDSAKRLTYRGSGAKHAIEFMLDDFLVLSKEGLGKTE